MNQIPYIIAGHPCIIEVTYFHYDRPQRGCSSSDIDARGDYECSYKVLDSRGNESPWLKSKICLIIDCEIDQLIFDTLKGE
jgi:hypothetical protein